MVLQVRTALISLEECFNIVRTVAFVHALACACILFESRNQGSPEHTNTREAKQRLPFCASPLINSVNQSTDPNNLQPVHEEFFWAPVGCLWPAGSAMAHISDGNPSCARRS